MIQYLAQLLHIAMNNGTLPAELSRARVSYSQWCDRVLVANYRLVSLTSVVCKQMEHVKESYLRQVLDKNDWLNEGQHGFNSGYSCDSQVITVCQHSVDSMDNGDRIDAILMDFSKDFGLRCSSARSVAYENCYHGREFEGSRMGKGVPFSSHAESKSSCVIMGGI